METPAQKVNLVSWSAIVRYAVISAINLAILLVGIAIGVMLAPHIERTVNANPAAQAQTGAPSQPATTALTSGPQKVQANMTAGTVGFYLLLAHHVQSDELVVNGIDLLKLHQAEINMLGRFVPPQEISRAISESKVPESALYQVAPGPPNPPTALTPKVNIPPSK